MTSTFQIIQFNYYLCDEPTATGPVIVVVILIIIIYLAQVFIFNEHLTLLVY